MNTLNTMAEFVETFYSGYTMLLVVGTGLMAYLIDYKKMTKQKKQKEANISKYIGLTYILGGILLYVAVIVLR